MSLPKLSRQGCGEGNSRTWATPEGWRSQRDNSKTAKTEKQGRSTALLCDAMPVCLRYLLPHWTWTQRASYFFIGVRSFVREGGGRGLHTPTPGHFMFVAVCSHMYIADGAKSDKSDNTPVQINHSLGFCNQPFMTKGPIVRPFCFGDCGDNTDMKRKIEGELRISGDEGCHTVTMAGHIPTLTCTSVIFVILNELHEDLADDVVRAMGPLGMLGLQDVTAHLVFKADSPATIEFGLRGRVLLPEMPVEAGVAKLIYDLFKKIVESVKFGMTAKLTGTEYVCHPLLRVQHGMPSYFSAAQLEN